MATADRTWTVVTVVSICCAIFVVVWGGPPCPVDYCATVVCPELNETDCDLVLRQATVCGCCRTCITYLKEGDKCNSIEPNDIGAVIVGNLQHCGPNLECDNINKVCTRRQTQCTDALAKYIAQREDDGWRHLGDPEPQCDEYGHFYRKQCRPGSMCYCVNRAGKRIFGETTDKVPMDVGCACSRDFDELKQVIGGFPTGEWMHEPSRRLQHFLRCKDTGDYDPLQCIDNNCFCLNDTMQIKAEVHDISGFRNLSCYDLNYHEETFYRPCEKEWNWTMSQQTYLLSEGYTVIGMDFPYCDLDGTYSPKQCRLNECYCADKEGKKIDGKYVTHRHNNDMKECRCARESIFLSRHRLTKKVNCDENGNYEEKQCLGPDCYKVDTLTGEQIGKEGEV